MSMRRRLQAPLDLLRSLPLAATIEDFGSGARMLGETVQCLFTNRPAATAFVDEIYQVGVRSFLVVAVASLATGLVMAIQFGLGLAKFGAKLYVPKVCTLSVVRELGALFTALMMAGRVGAGIASEVGSMRVTQQIDAIRALGTDPIRRIVAPKIVACTLAAPLLAIMADMIGIWGGMLISSTQLGLSAYDYFFKAFEIIYYRDFMGGVIKSVFFGLIIGTVGCWYGMNTTGGTQGVGSATTRAVVTASVMVMIADFILTKGLWIIENLARGGTVM